MQSLPDFLRFILFAVTLLLIPSQVCGFETGEISDENKTSGVGGKITEKNQPLLGDSLVPEPESINRTLVGFSENVGYSEKLVVYVNFDKTPYLDFDNSIRHRARKIIKNAFRQEKQLALVPAKFPINSPSELYQTTGTVIPVHFQGSQYLNIYFPNPALQSRLADYEWRLLAIQAAEFKGMITRKEADFLYSQEIDRIRLRPDGDRILSQIILEYQNSTPEQRIVIEQEAKKNTSEGFLNGALLGSLAAVALGLLSFRFIQLPQLRVSQSTLDLARLKTENETAEEERKKELHHQELIKRRLEIKKLSLENRVTSQKLEQDSKKPDQDSGKTDSLGNDYY
jgi:hypothetical protein